MLPANRQLWLSPATTRYILVPTASKGLVWGMRLRGVKSGPFRAGLPVSQSPGPHILLEFGRVTV